MRNSPRNIDSFERNTPPVMVDEALEAQEELIELRSDGLDNRITHMARARPVVLAHASGTRMRAELPVESERTEERDDERVEDRLRELTCRVRTLTRAASTEDIEREEGE
jgi:hypothetical protein